MKTDWYGRPAADDPTMRPRNPTPPSPTTEDVPVRLASTIHPAFRSGEYAYGLAEVVEKALLQERRAERARLRAQIREPSKGLLSERRGGIGDAQCVNPLDTKAPGIEAAAQPKVNVIAVGGGNFVVNHGRYGGKPALFIEPAPIPGAVGADASDSGLDKADVIDGGTIITFDNAESAAVLCDAIRALAPHGEEK